MGNTVDLLREERMQKKTTGGEHVPFYVAVTVSRKELRRRNNKWAIVATEAEDPEDLARIYNIAI